MNRKRICAAALLFSLALSGCGQSQQTPQTTQSPEQRESVSLSVWCPEEELSLMNRMAESFSAAHGEADFSIIISGESEETCKATVLASPENAADIFAFASDQFTQLHSGGALLPITRNTENIIAENGGAENGAIVGASSGGTLYAYPKTASNGYFLYYNSSYFSSEDVKSLDKMLEKAAENGKKVMMDLTSGWYMYSFFEAAGLTLNMNEDGLTNTCNWNSTTTPIKGVDVAEAMLSISENAGFQSGTDDDFKKGVIDGSVIAGINGSWNASTVEEAWGENYAAAPLPTYSVAGQELQMHSFAGYKYVGVNAYTDEPNWAMALAEWITNEENQTLRFQEMGEGPSNVNAAASPEVQAAPAIAALSEQSAYGHLQNVAETFWTPSYVFGTIISSGNSDGRDLQELLDEMTAEITAPPKEE